MQAVPLGQDVSSIAPPPRAVYDWQESSSSLFAAGGAQPAVAHRWDLRQELCTQQVFPPTIAPEPATYVVMQEKVCCLLACFKSRYKTM